MAAVLVQTVIVLIVVTKSTGGIINISEHQMNIGEHQGDMSPPPTIQEALQYIRLKFYFDNGVIIWTKDPATLTSLFEYTPNSNCSLQVQLNDGLLKNVKLQTDQFDIKATNKSIVRLNIIDSLSSDNYIEGFVAVKPSDIGQYKYLPFRLADLKSMLLLKIPPLFEEEDKDQYVDINFPLPPECVNATDGQTLTSLQLTEPFQDLLAAALLVTISYNEHLNLEEAYHICMIDTSYRDLPFTLKRCCAAKEKLIFELNAADHHIECISPDGSRVSLTILSSILGVLAFMFMPLLVVFIPGEPEGWQAIKQHFSMCIHRNRNKRKTQLKRFIKYNSDRWVLYMISSCLLFL